jgi:NCAIR mutase (PurE)-related protein
MELNLPPKIRAAIYIIVVIGTATLLPLNLAGVVDNVVLSVWTSVSGAASLLAALNVNTKGIK